MSYPTEFQLVDEVLQLVALPQVYQSVEEAIHDGSKSMDDIANLISADVDLSMRILGISNSALFGFASKVETINRALTLVGTQQLRDIVLATELMENFRNVPNNLIDMQRFWQHSILTGTLARAIATYRREQNIESYYVAGLMHDIGRMVLYLRVPEPMVEMLKRLKKEETPLYEMEKEILGYDHAQLGASLLQSWSIPDNLSVPIRYHHTPVQAPEAHRQRAATIYAADMIANSLAIGSSGERRVPPLNEMAWECVEVKDSAIPEVIDRALEQYDSLKQIFF